MGDQSHDSSRVGLLGRKALDAVVYGVAMVALVTIPSAFLELSGRGSLYTTKHVLFWLGFALLAYASFQLRPDAPYHSDDESRTFTSGNEGTKKRSETTVGGRKETRLEKVVAWLPPLRWYPLAVDDRFSVHAKMVLGSVLMLVLSMLMEFVFGIAQPGTRGAAAAVTAVALF